MGGAAINENYLGKGRIYSFMNSKELDNRDGLIYTQGRHITSIVTKSFSKIDCAVGLMLKGS